MATKKQASPDIMKDVQIPPNLVQTVQSVIMKPEPFFKKLVPEKNFMKLAMYVAIIGLAWLIGLIGGWAIAWNGLFLGNAVAIGVIMWIGMIILPFAAGFAIDILAESLKVKKGAEQYTTIAAYAFTPALLAGILNIIPVIGGILALIGGLYSLYLLYIGFSVKFGNDKAIPLAVVAIIAMVVVGLIFWLIASAIAFPHFAAWGWGANYNFYPY